MSWQLSVPATHEARIVASSLHHAGAVQMADDEWRSSGDLRLRLMAQAIRHERQGEIALMNNVNGIEAVQQATLNMLANNL
jgi:uncharacterized protein (DUF305 family)